MSLSIKTALVILVLLSCFSFINQFKLSGYFPIKTVRVYGINRVDRQEVQDVMQPLVDKGFFTINVDYLRDRLLQMPWVSDVSVRRGWPDEVDVTVVEKRPAAYWGDENLLSDSGEIFTPRKDTYPVKLPKFVGPEGQQVVMLQYFNEINRLFTALHAKISYLEMTPYATWKLKLDSGVKLEVGHKDILTRLDNFVRVYPKIVGEKAADVDSIDLRYSNGVAVRWKS